MKLKPIKIEATNKALSANGGVYLLHEAFDRLSLEKDLAPHLPSYKIATETSGYDKFKALCLGLADGIGALEDMDHLADDSVFGAVCGKINASNTYGEFLRAFTAYQCKNLNYKLIETSLKLRKAIHPKATEFILDIDSTSHEQHGKKIEGASFNYDSIYCLDSLQAYDQFGFQYWMDVRPGSTFTANGVPEVIHEVFRKVPEKTAKYLRIDSGNCNVDVFNAARTAGAKFAAAMRENMWSPLLPRVKTWRRSKQVRFHDDREVEIGETIYFPKKGREILRVVFIRALMPREQNQSLFQDIRYDYRAFVTNIRQHEMRGENVIRFYRGRGNAENFIKEYKNGFSLYHFPCQKIVANKAFGLIGAFAYNLMRYAAFVMNQARPQYSKAVRFRMIHLACEVVKHAGYMVFRFPKIIYQEVQHWLTTIQKQFEHG
jgi:hypothetical protein